MPDEGTDLKPRRLLPQGGARNRRDRESWQLTEKNCRDLIAATGVALAIGMPFNRFATLAFGKCGIDAKDCVAATGEWITLAREWFAGHGLPMPWAWVQEWGSVNLAHCHVLFHVPPEFDDLFRGKAAQWARHVIAKRGGTYRAGATDCQKIRSSKHPERYPEAYRAAVAFKVHYMLKCAPERLESELGMQGRGPKPWGQQCSVYGKRFAIWQKWKDLADRGHDWL